MDWTTFVGVFIGITLYQIGKAATLEMRDRRRRQMRLPAVPATRVKDIRFIPLKIICPHCGRRRDLDSKGRILEHRDPDTSALCSGSGRYIFRGDSNA